MELSPTTGFSNSGDDWVCHPEKLMKMEASDYVGTPVLGHTSSGLAKGNKSVFSIISHQRNLFKPE